jgi:small subunit ribosomal protein S2
MFFVNQRWLGGTLTNFQTVKKSIDKLTALENMEGTEEFQHLPKKEILGLQKKRAKLEKTLGGIKDMGGLPAAVFIVDPKRERIAVHEARKLEIPIVAIVDTNCDPDEIDYVIPGNDDAIRAIRLFSAKVADAALEGLSLRQEGTEEEPPREPGKESASTGTTDDSADIEVIRVAPATADTKIEAESSPEEPETESDSLDETDDDDDESGR